MDVQVPISDTDGDVAECVRRDVDAAGRKTVALHRRERSIVPDDLGDRIRRSHVASSSAILRRARRTKDEPGSVTLRLVPEYVVRALDESTWPAFATLVEDNNGVFGGCWCMGFHEDARGTEPPKRERKLARVREGTAHAALVFEEDNCLGWCQFGVPGEVPRIKNRAAYEKDLTVLPDWRIACNFVGKGHGVRCRHCGARRRTRPHCGSRRWECRGLSRGCGLRSCGLSLSRRSLDVRKPRIRSRRKIGKHRWVVAKVVESNS